MSLKYSIFDPTGNITALVESEVEISRQPEVAALIMERHPQVEQVGFVRFAFESDPIDDGLSCERLQMAEKQISESLHMPDEQTRKSLHMTENRICGSLRMAGGEFCGNASMCAAALYLLRKRGRSGDALSPDETEVHLRVSGASAPVKVRLRKTDGQASFSAGILMPGAAEIDETMLSFEKWSGNADVVRMEGITHIILKESSPLFGLLGQRPMAEAAARTWCGELGAKGLGLMFLSKKKDLFSLTPLVYIPEGQTIFWENSCASGSAAVGMDLAARQAGTGKVVLKEPGGDLVVESSPESGSTWLYGKCRMIMEE